MRRCGCILLIGFLGSLAAAAEPRPTVIVVVGAEGAKEYAEPFREWAGRWEAAARQGQAEFTAIGLAESGDKTDRELFEQRLAALHALVRATRLRRIDWLNGQAGGACSMYCWLRSWWRR